MTTRRDVLHAAAAVPLGLLTRPGAAATTALAAPPYTISINIEIMFNTGRGNPPMPRADRIRAVAAKGFKAYSYWNAAPEGLRYREAEVLAVTRKDEQIGGMEVPPLVVVLERTDEACRARDSELRGTSFELGTMPPHIGADEVESPVCRPRARPCTQKIRDPFAGVEA